MMRATPATRKNRVPRTRKLEPAERRKLGKGIIKEKQSPSLDF